MKANHTRIYCLVGPSGVGKTTVVRELVRKQERRRLPKIGGDLKFKEVVSTTTREPREGEIDGVDYWFVNCEDVKREEFVELVEYNGNFYGLRMHDLMLALAQRKIPLVVVDRNGVMRLQEVFGEAFVCPLLLLPPWPRHSVLKKRMEIQGRSEEAISQRLDTVKDECAFNLGFEQAFVNQTGKLEQCVEQVYNFISSDMGFAIKEWTKR